MFTPPYKIFIKSDLNEMKLVNTIQKSKNNQEVLYVYEFTKSLTKLGIETMFTELVLRKLLLYSFKEI